MDTISEINVVPLVDIVLVVLIIFMVTAPALVKPSIEVNLPEASHGDSTEPSLLNIAITGEGQVMINNEVADETKVKDQALVEFQRNPEVQAIIIADRSLPYGKVIKVLDWVKSSGVKNFSVTTDQPVDAID
ncbi:MAG: biopolymer transporter ExbD [Bdellovibrionales bacterium]|nr:biopolymer transporter ExbD [Bdellovibrionales bacterium]